MMGECYSGPVHGPGRRAAGRSVPVGPGPVGTGVRSPAGHGRRRPRPRSAGPSTSTTRWPSARRCRPPCPRSPQSASSTRTGVPIVVQRSRRSSAWRARPGTVPRSHPSGPEGLEQGVEELGPVHRVPGQLAQGGGRPHQVLGQVVVAGRPVHVDPDPDDDGRRSTPAGPGTGARSASARTPASFRPSPPNRSLGHLMPGRTPATDSARLGGGQGHRGTGTGGVAAAGRSGRSRTDTSRLAPGGASQRRSSRPRPARLVVGHGHHALGSPGPGLARAGTDWSSRSSSKRRMSVNRGPGMAHTLRAVTV